MTTEAATINGAPATPAPEQGAASSTPPPSLSAAPSGPDYKSLWEREQARANGMHKFYEKAKGLGFGKPEDFDGYEKFSQVLKKRGLTVEQARILMAGEQPAENGHAGGPYDSRIEALERAHQEAAAERKRLDDELFTHARDQHEREREAELKAIIAELNGDFEEGDPARDVYLKAAELDWMREREKSLYDEGHRLHGYDYRLLGEEGRKKIVGSYKEALAKRKAGEFLRVGEAAKNAKPSTPGGNTSGQGTKDKPTGRKDGADEFGEAFDRAMASQRSR